MSMHPCITVIEDIFHQCMHDSYVRNLISTNGIRRHHQKYWQRKVLSQNDYSYLKSCENNQTSAFIFDQYFGHAFHHILLFRDFREKSDNPINIDWSNVNCKEFDKFSEHLGYATTTFATSISSRYNTNRNDFMTLLSSLKESSNKV